MRKYNQLHPLYSNLSSPDTCISRSRTRLCSSPAAPTMPEGPELCTNSRFVNNVCKDRIFNGKVVKSSVSKCCNVDFTSEAYTITSEARGKEVALTLQCTLDPQKKLRLLFRFGMSGKFMFGPVNELPKHAHLQFFSTSTGEGKSEISNVLSFVDVRRFGSWHITPVGWGENRGPDPMFEYEAFRSNVLQNLDDPAFSRPICEALLNQKYFNGIGNYLRAEILFQAGIPPFTCARKVLESLCECESDPVSSKKDILLLCHTLPQEVVDLKQKLGKSESSAVTEDDVVAFCQWLECYENPSMNNMRDHNGRTIWFKGEAGPMCPRNQKSRRHRKYKGRVSVYKVESETSAGVEEGCEEILGVKEEESKGAKRKYKELVGVKGEPNEELEEVKEGVKDGSKIVSRRQGRKRRGRETTQRNKPSAKRTRTQEKESSTKPLGTKSKLHDTPPPTRRSSRLKNKELKT